jgi:outer membrane lipoprotein SlyB
VAGAFGALGGSVVGGLVGVSVEHAAGDTKAYEYIVRKPNGDLVSVTQKDESPLSVGRHVLVIAGAQARIVPDYTVIADPDAGKTPPKPDAPAAAKADAPPKVAADAVMPPALPAITQPGVSTLLEPLKSGVVPDLP